MVADRWRGVDGGGGFSALGIGRRLRGKIN